jgi:hypothetical protein
MIKMIELSAKVIKKRVKAEATNWRQIRVKNEKTYHLMKKKSIKYEQCNRQKNMKT